MSKCVRQRDGFDKLYRLQDLSVYPTTTSSYDLSDPFGECQKDINYGPFSLNLQWTGTQSNMSTVMSYLTACNNTTTRGYFESGATNQQILLKTILNDTGNGPGNEYYGQNNYFKNDNYNLDVDTILTKDDVHFTQMGSGSWYFTLCFSDFTSSYLSSPPLHLWMWIYFEAFDHVYKNETPVTECPWNDDSHVYLNGGKRCIDYFFEYFFNPTLINYTNSIGKKYFWMRFYFNKYYYSSDNIRILLCFNKSSSPWSNGYFTINNGANTNWQSNYLYTYYGIMPFGQGGFVTGGSMWGHQFRLNSSQTSISCYFQR